MQDTGIYFPQCGCLVYINLLQCCLCPVCLSKWTVAFIWQKKIKGLDAYLELLGLKDRAETLASRISNSNAVPVQYGLAYAS
jgi:hypothetical protein